MQHDECDPFAGVSLVPLVTVPFCSGGVRVWCVCLVACTTCTVAFAWGHGDAGRGDIAFIETYGGIAGDTGGLLNFACI
jgi:hypothetical protein